MKTGSKTGPFLFSALFIIAALAYVLMNRGITREIAGGIAVGEDISIPSRNGTIRASFFPGSTTERSPAVIMISGSSANSYRKSWEPGNTGFWRPLTELLNSAGYAVLLLEKRGINGSAGHWEHQSFEDRAEDVKDAVEYLQARHDIDSKRLGLAGHSQGGWIAQLTSVMYPGDAAFVINLAGPSTSVIEQALDDYGGEYKIAGLPEAAIQRKLAVKKWLLNVVNTLPPVIKFGNISYIIRYDSEHIRKNITVPVFAVYAENDRLVPSEKNRALLEEGLKISGNRRYEIYVVPDANHGFKPSPFGTPEESLQAVEPSKEFFEVMEKFVVWEKTLLP